METYILWAALAVFFGLPLLLTAGTLWLHVLDALDDDRRAKRTDFPRMKDLAEKGIEK